MKRLSHDLKIVGCNEENPKVEGVLIGRKEKEIRGETRGYYLLEHEGEVFGLWESGSLKVLDSVLKTIGQGAKVCVTWLELQELDGGKTYNRFAIELDDESAEKFEAQAC